MFFLPILIHGQTCENAFIHGTLTSMTAVNAGAIEAVVVAMRAHATSEGLQARACGVQLRNITSSIADNMLRTKHAGALEAAVAALRQHSGSINMREQACLALRNLTGGKVENTAWAGKAGDVEAMVAAMRKHAGIPKVQRLACVALYFSIVHNASGEQDLSGRRRCEGGC